MDNHITDICRFCTEEREEFNHLAYDCPALWFERQTINSQVPSHSNPHDWTPQQILDFTFFPRINEAFAKPLFLPEQLSNPSDPSTQTQQDDPDDLNMEIADSDTDMSVMDVSSLDSSTSGADDSHTDISVD